jgi:hypothetical protein
MARFELKCLELRRLSLSNSKSMKKLIGLLGAAGMLIPSAAMAGSIGNNSGTDAIRTTAASYSVQDVKVKSNIFRKNDMHVSGTSRGNTKSYSAENYIDGGGDLTYVDYDLTAQSAAEIDFGNLRVQGKYNIYGKDTDHTNSFSKETGNGGSGGSGCDKKKSCKTSKKGGGSRRGSNKDTVNRDRDNSTETYKAKGKFKGSAKGTADYAATLDTQTTATTITGGASLQNGAFSSSFDAYTGKYKGDLFEKGRTQTKVSAHTDTVTTSNGFESGHFNTTEWN